MTTSEEMTFVRLHEGTDCKCTDDGRAQQNTAHLFARRTKTMQPVDGDFLSWREMGKDESQYTECDDICNFRGVSISKIDGYDENKIMKHYRKTVELTPWLPRFYCRFRFKLDAGKVWPSPSKKDESHHTLFKCDKFSVDLLEVIEVVPLV